MNEDLSLSELIDKCGKNFDRLKEYNNGWNAQMLNAFGNGIREETKEKAVLKLLELLKL